MILVDRGRDGYDYGCGICGDQTIVLQGHGGDDLHPYWVVACGEGHVVEPVPGIWLKVSAG